jgi:anti-anti-sigma factor
MHEKELIYSIKKSPVEGTIVVRLDGPLLLGNMFAFQAELRELLSPVTVFDLSNSEYMDSAGLGVLMNFYVSAEKNGRKMALAGVNERIGALLDLTHVRALLRTFPSVEEALATR